MATIKFNNVGISAIAACVPQKIMRNSELSYLMSEDELARVIENVGIEERRYAEPEVCSSDLCEKAALALFDSTEIDRDNIDALIFVSQTPDYHQPATAPLLQSKLGLKKTTLAFDINLACSGYVYGLANAFSFASQQGINNVLLLVGETMSKTVSHYDKVSTPLFGDAGTATMITKGNFGPSVFSLNSDGSKSDVIKMKYGGYRHPSCSEGFLELVDKDGNVRTGEQFFMDGMDVFNFGISVEPKDIKKLLNESGKTIDDINVLVYHQANRFMTDFFSKKLKISPEKTPYSLKHFGNTSSASIPLTIVSEMLDKFPNRKNCVLSGFGAGLSWGSVFLDLSDTKIVPLIEY